MPFKTKSHKLSRYNSVNDADMWEEGYSSYLGRSHERVEMNIIRNTDNSCREKSAEAIVDDSNELKKKERYSEVSQIIEGLNLNEVKVNECYPMKGRKQKISQDTSHVANRSETEIKLGGQTYMGIAENSFTTIEQADYGLLAMILSPTNLNKAYKQVKSNKGSGGIDGLGVDELLGYLHHHKEALLQSIIRGKYKPNPVRRVEIPKEGGKKRQLGIPTVVDRVVQQSIAQQLSPIYEPLFSHNSYGFRPKRSAHDALKQCQQYISDGYTYTVDMDLEKYFDTVSHSKLIEVLSKTIKDGRVISLIHKYMNADVI